jgi:hypothetical protein
MNALKQSFSQRAMRARSLGEKDKITDLTLAAIDMGKVRSVSNYVASRFGYKRNASNFSVEGIYRKIRCLCNCYNIIRLMNLLQAYAKTFNTTNEACKELRICEAARECVQDVGQANAYGLCHFSA